MSQPNTFKSLRPLLALIALLVLTSLACSIGETLVGRSQADVPTPTKTPRPTFTPLPSASPHCRRPRQVSAARCRRG